MSSSPSRVTRPRPKAPIRSSPKAPTARPTLIVNTDGEYTYLGRLVVEFDANGEIMLASLAANQAINGAYAATDENVAEAWGTTVDNLATTAFADGTKGDKVEDLTDAVQAVINVKDGNVFGFTDVYLEGERAIVRNAGDQSRRPHRRRQCLGGATRRSATCPFLVSLKNGGGIRAQIGTVSDPDPVTGEIDKLPPAANPDAGKPEGGVSQLDVENSLRFNNKLMVFDTTRAGTAEHPQLGRRASRQQRRLPADRRGEVLLRSGPARQRRVDAGLAHPRRGADRRGRQRRRA